MSYTNIAHIGHLHSEGIRYLTFYKEQIALMEKRLLEVAGKNTSHEAGVGVEHFQNQFIVQKNNIDMLKHRINELSQKIGEDVKLHAGHIEQQKVEEEKLLTEESKTVEKLVNDLHREFNLFLSKWI
jgi:hypothetical protein